MMMNDDNSNNDEKKMNDDDVDESKIMMMMMVVMMMMMMMMNEFKLEMTCSQVYNIEMIDRFKSQCRELLDLWPDIQNTDPLLIRDGGSEAC